MISSEMSSNSINHTTAKSKIFTTLLSTMLSLSIGLTVYSQKSFADKITWDQRKELFYKGTLTDKKGNTWNILYIPGVENIKLQSKGNIEEAAEILKELTKKEFWQERYEEVKDGVETAKDATMDYWINGIKNDYKDAKMTSAAIVDGEFGAAGARAATWTKFGLKATGRTVTFPIGVAYGIGVESTLQPLTSIVGTPLWSGVVALGGGVVIPGVMYVWNGAAWVATSVYTNEPTSENSYIVLKNPKNEKEGSLIIDKKGFDTILMGSVVKALTKLEIQTLQTQADIYYKQYQEITNKQDQTRTAMYENSSYKLLEKLLYESYSKAEVKLDEESKQIVLDDAKLETLIKEYLISINVDPTEEKVTQIKATLKENLKSLLKEVSTLAPRA